MGLVLFVVLSALEVTLAVIGRGKEKEKKVWLKNRLLVRAAEVAIVLIALLLPCGQKWRLIPLLGFLAVLGIIALLRWLGGRRKDNVKKKTGSAIINCIFSILFISLLLVPAFLFTGYKGLPVSGQYPIAQTSVIVIDSSRTDPFEQDGSFREVPVHFYYPADAAGGERFPLVVFSHGAFGYYQSNTSTYMELASNGYVVAALDHPHHAFFTRDTEGKTVLADMDFISTAMNLNSMDDREVQYALYRDWMALRTADMNFAVDEIKTAAQTGAADESWYISEKDGGAIQTVLGMTDVSRIGLMGHSMGGATAVQLGRERSDIAAVIDLDGTMLGEYVGVENGEMLVRDDPYTVPVLDLNNWESYNNNEEYIARGFPYPNVEVVGHAAEGFSVGIRDSRHMDFTDLPLLSPFLGKMLGSGERSTEEIMTIVNSLVLSFFNCYLKGEGVFTAQELY